MSYQIRDINYRLVTDPAGLIEEGDARYQNLVDEAAEYIIGNLQNSPIVLLSGPSGSGKTTTAMKIADALKRRGIGTHYVSMDDYFRTVDEDTPRTSEGALDLESPLCLDMELLNEHFTRLSRGERIELPRYDFTMRARAPESSRSIQLGRDEVVIFEGIHALNGSITQRHREAFKLYISARSDVFYGESMVFKRSWFRLVRRMVRDYNFRGSSPDDTLAMWANVRRGEKLYISPFKNKADFQFDTSLPYELPVFNTTATMLFRSIPEGIERYDELRLVLPAIQMFGHIDEALVPKTSLLREFIGGGVYTY